MKAGDFTGLAENYTKYRVGYSDTILRDIAAMLPCERQEARVLDVGAGTGIWSRQLSQFFGSCTAIEPNNDMRITGQAADSDSIEWKPGAAEDTGEPSDNYHWVTMASSFHWTDYVRALTEFGRILKPNGLFTCLWNPRIVEGHPLLEEIEAEVDRVVPRERRQSSGSSRFVESLTEKLAESGEFDSVVYMEDRCTVPMSRERYLGLWRSVNDIRAQAGDDKFEQLMVFIEQRTAGIETLECPYLTRSWTVRKVESRTDSELEHAALVHANAPLLDDPITAPEPNNSAPDLPCSAYAFPFPRRQLYVGLVRHVLEKIGSFVSGARFGCRPGFSRADRPESLACAAT